MTATAVSSTDSTNTLQSLTASKSAKKVSEAEATQNRFLTLLTTQLKNQDPMNPVDSAQATSQLAQISTVQGIDNLNTTMKTLLGSYKSSETLQAAALVGHSVLTEGDRLALQKGVAVGGFDLASDADSVSISIRNASGIEVANEVMSKQAAGSHDFAWDGKASDGTAAADGTYTFKVTATQGATAVSATALEMSLVTSVVNGDSGITLDAGRFSGLSMSDVRRII